MSIETEFQSTIQNVQNAYNGLNNLGATIPQNKTIENIKSCLDEIYDRLPKTEFEEGESVTLENTLKGKLDFENGVVGIGQTSQESTQGYQLLNINATSGAKNGATWVVNEDKSITIKTNGATTGLVTIPVVTSKTLEAGTYYASGVTGGTENTYYFGILSPNNWVFRNYNGITQFSVSEESTYSQIWIVIASGITISTPITVYPMISKTNTSNYEPYTGGQASPNPSYPQEIKYVRGKNLFNKATVTQRSYIDAQGVLKGADGTYCASDYIEVHQGSIVWGATTGNGYSLSIYDSSKTFIRSVGRTGNNAMVIPIANGEKYIRFTLLTADLDITQIEEGTQATPYLPYNTIEEVVSGKNLLPFKFNSNTLNGITLTANDDGTIKINGTSTANTTLGGTSLATYTLKKGTYTYSIENALISGANITIWYGTNSTIKSLGTTTSTDFEVLEDTTYQWFRLSLYIPSGQTYNNVILKPMIRKSSITDDTYEPYKTPKTYQFSLGDHKFYKIGTYRDYILRTTGKNLVNPTEIKDASINSTTGDTITYYSSSASKTYVKCAYVKQGVAYTFSKKPNTPSSSAGRIIDIVDDNEVILEAFSVLPSATSYTYTPNHSGWVYMVVDVNATEIQIEEGSTASDYQPYGAGNWYKVGNVYKRVFDGTENNWTYNTVTQGSLFRYNKLENNKKDNSIVNYSNYYKGLSASQASSRANNLFYIQVLEATSGYIDIIDNRYTDVDDFKTWLTTHNLEVYYVLATPTYTPITGDLATQLEAFWNAQSNNGTTIITSNGNLPMIIKVRALKGE